MSDNIKKINRREIRLGMYVSGYGAGTFKDPYVDVGKLIESYADVEEYIPKNAECVEIMTEELEDVFVESRSQKRISAEKSAQTLVKALPEARRIHDESLKYARHFMDGIREGKVVEVKAAGVIVDQIIDNLYANEPAALTLAFLKKYDEYTYTHCINVNLYSLLLGRQLGLDYKNLKKLGISALFHDVGKGKIPNAVLKKPGKLTDEEFEVMKSHPLHGLEVMSCVKGMEEDMLKGVVEHHERYDGKGYPRQLKGEMIHPFGRIIAISDVYDALTSVRVYKEAMAPSKTLGLMYKWAGSNFDPKFLKEFTRAIGVYPPGTIVQLNDKRYALVIESNTLSPLKPKVKVLFDKRMMPVRAEYIDLSPGGGGNGVEVLAQPDPGKLGIDMKSLATFLV